MKMTSFGNFPKDQAASAPEPGDSIFPEPADGWPAEVQKTQYLSSADNTAKPTLFYNPGRSRPVPLLVALHTWSYNYLYKELFYATWCIARRWALVHPEFRGPNNRPEACGSELAVKDIIGAVEYAKRNANIDPCRIYLVGVSGGGMAALLMAGRAPEIWAAVSAWCPIFNLKDWHGETLSRKLAYAQMIENVCGGTPGKNPAVDEEYRRRSPSAWLARAGKIPLDINAGIADGHRGSVPVSHTIRAFNTLAAAADRIPEADIAAMLAEPKMPGSLLQPHDDPLYRRGRVLYRKISGNARVTIFDGGHNIFAEAALAWLEKQRKDRPPVWKIKNIPDVNLDDFPAEAGK